MGSVFKALNPIKPIKKIGGIFGSRPQVAKRTASERAALAAAEQRTARNQLIRDRAKARARGRRNLNTLLSRSSAGNTQVGVV